ncbi:hypothetical protein WOC76_21370 [Methylocystis sp. IM3]|uniref:hypothetical protein n=1 Tax=unclassified Methylocystis TaxID=2625913 RepID=UPI0030FB7564
MAYEFQSKLYQTAEGMCRAIASTWLSPVGLNNRERMLEFLADSTDEELADDAIKGFGLDRPEGDNAELSTWMEDRGIIRNDIASAFARIRKDLDERSS